MPKYYCDYCDTYLTHDSPSVRKTHCSGRKHKENVRIYYQKWLEEQVQKLVDDTTAAFKAGKIQNNPFAPGGKGAAIPPPVMPGPPKVLKPNLPGPMPNLPPNMPPGAMGMPMPMGGHMPMMGPGPMPGMLGMRPMGPMGPMMGGPMGMRPMMSGPGAPGTAPPPRK